MSDANPKMNFNELTVAIKQVHDQLAAQASKAVNISLTLRNWLIGAYIAKYELCGEDRAKYGDKLLSKLSNQLNNLNLSNSNRRQLYDYLNFFRAYPQIMRSASAQLQTLLPQEVEDIIEKE